MILRRASIAFLVIYALLIAATIAIYATGIRIPMFITPLATLVGFTFGLLHAAQREGWTNALRLLVLVFGVSLLFESVGVATGLVYGPYHYTEKLGPLFLGLVPYLIPVAWFMMSYPSFVIADRLIPSTWKRGQRILAVAVVGGIVMTAWDMVMDPVMVWGGHWVWDVEGPYYGIPLQNYWGWWLTVFTTYALYLLLAGKQEKPADARSDRLPVLMYMIVGLANIIPLFIGGVSDLGLIGVFVMVPWAVAGLIVKCQHA